MVKNLNILEAKSRGLNYFPEEPVVISGGLEERYKEISKESKKDIATKTNLKMDTVLKTAIKNKDRVTFGDVTKVPEMFVRKIGKIFSGNRDDMSK